MTKFSPKGHLIKLKGKDYLETKWRLVWFREDWPNGIIQTEPIEITPQVAIIRATVTAVDADGVNRGSATGTKSETPQRFKDGYIEKAETGAIGRALAALGYGTQFEPDLEDGDNVVDSPVAPAQPVRTPVRPQDATQRTETPNAGTDTPANNATARAMARMHAVAGKHGIDHDGLRTLAAMKAKQHGIVLTSLKYASADLMNEITDGIEAKPDDTRKWLAKQAELLPSPDDVPNPGRFTN